MEYYSVLNRFDARKRRISIFGRMSNLNPEEMVITKITCSKKDQFSKKFAHAAYRYACHGLGNNRYHLVHPEIFKIKLENPATPKKEFLKFVNENYYRMVEREIYFSQRVLNIKQIRRKKQRGLAFNVKYLTK